MPTVNDAPTSRGLLGRLAHAVKAALGTAPSPAVDGEGGLHPLLQPHAAKVTTAARAVAAVADGQRVFVGTACATPRTLLAALEALQPAPADVELVHFLTDGALPAPAAGGAAASRYRHRSFFVGQEMRAAVREGRADYVPMSIARVPGLIRLGRIPVDVALIQVSLPDAFGYVSLGVSVDLVSAAVARAALVIAEVNPAMPRSHGDSMLHVDTLDWLVPVATPVTEYRHSMAAEGAVAQIARYIGSVIEDGSTLQIGMGRYTNEALKHLSDRQDLGIHSDVITDALIPLLERGIVTGRRKTQQVGKVVTSFAMGSRALYDLIDDNPLFCFLPIDQVADPMVIAAQHKMVSVTQAFAVDLTGQVCADQFNGEFYSGLAAQGEFLQGASRSPGGKAIICLESSDAAGASSRIRARLHEGEGVSIARNDVHYVITEYGIAYLFGKSIRERAIALIDIAHPAHREALLAQAKALGYVGDDQTLNHRIAYRVEDERHLTLGDGRAVLLRPAMVADGDAIRTLFHQLPDRDVYTRFFRNVRSLSSMAVQRLCNLNAETEVAMVAVTGPRESAQIVAQACYMVDPTTNLAETAFMVHPDWQGCGLGSALQQHLAAHARSRGVRGFVAEMVRDNQRMLRLARNASVDAQVERLADTVRVTTLWD
jgi:acyl-CoA hydrolase/L-amino acid N-acyltransferase YncA